jgi:hypothetical protein
LADKDRPLDDRGRREAPTRSGGLQGSCAEVARAGFQINASTCKTSLPKVMWQS